MPIWGKVVKRAAKVAFGAAAKRANKARKAYKKGNPKMTNREKRAVTGLASGLGGFGLGAATTKVIDKTQGTLVQEQKKMRANARKRRYKKTGRGSM